MYTLGIPDRQKHRTLGYLMQNEIPYKEHPSMDGFFDVSFPGVDKDQFRNIVMKLKQQGVTTIDAVANSGKTIAGAAFKGRIKDEDELTTFVASPAYDPENDDGIYALKGELITIKDGKIVDRLTLATID